MGVIRQVSEVLTAVPTIEGAGVHLLRVFGADQGMRMNFAGDSHDAYSVVIDSALGLLGARGAGRPAPGHDRPAALPGHAGGAAHLRLRDRGAGGAGALPLQE